MKYVIYLRVSTDEQDLRTQEQKCMKFLRYLDQSDFDYQIFTDKISSRKSLDKRLGIQGALESLREGDILVCQKIDRLARNAYETHTIVYLLEQKKCEIIMIDQPGIKNKVILGMYAGIAEEEVKTIRERIKDKLGAKKERNERISGRLPYGYTLDPINLVEVNGPNKTKVLKPGYLVEESHEQMVLSLMFRLFDEGKSYRQIARMLENEGYKNRQGKPFPHMNIYQLIAKRGTATSSDRLQESSK